MIFGDILKVWARAKKCETCSYYKSVSYKDNRGYMNGEMCKCKDSKYYREFIDSSYCCPCYRKNKKK